MGSWLRCKCGGNIHKNLFCGTGISLVASEDYIDTDRSGIDAETFISDLIATSTLLLRCHACGRIVLLREASGVSEARFFIEDKGTA